MSGVDWAILGVFVALVLGVAADIYSTSDMRHRRQFDRRVREGDKRRLKAALGRRKP